jgi:hypothetical protein
MSTSATSRRVRHELRHPPRRPRHPVGRAADFPFLGGIPDDRDARFCRDVGLTVFHRGGRPLRGTARDRRAARPRRHALPHHCRRRAHRDAASRKLFGFWFGSRVLKMPLPILLGALAGAQTRDTRDATP